MQDCNWFVSEHRYRERVAQVYSAVKRRLDYQVELVSTKKRLEQQHMVNWIVDSVVSGITPKQVRQRLSSVSRQRLSSVSRQHLSSVSCQRLLSVTSVCLFSVLSASLFSLMSAFLQCHVNVSFQSHVSVSL